MADLSAVLPLLQALLGGGSLGSVGKFYQSNKALVDALLILVQQQLAKPQAPQPAAPAPPAPAAPPPTPAPPPPVSVPPASMQGYASLRAEIFFFEKAKRSGIYSKSEYDAIVRGDSAQLLDDFAHMNISPFDEQGKEIRTGDPRHPSPDANGPRLRYRWWIDGVQQQDSGDDHFNLGSVKDDQGCTPTLRLVKQWGQGKGRAEFEAYIPADANGPYGEVVSNRVGWFVD